MLLKSTTLEGIREGRVSRAYRRWKRPTVNTGGTLNTRIGQLAIDLVELVSVESLMESDARAAGADDLASLKEMLFKRPEGDTYCIHFHVKGPDPRIDLRLQIPEGEDLKRLLNKLDRLDRASSLGSWTGLYLRMIADHAGARAADLAARIHVEKAPFKINVRKLKALGLTESLEIGYRLSPRGQAVLNHLADVFTD